LQVSHGFSVVYPKASYTGKVRETFAPWGFTVRGVNEEAKPAEAVKNAQVSVRLPHIFLCFRAVNMVHPQNFRFQNVWFQNVQFFKFDILIKQKVQELPSLHSYLE
jgi:hypothetical protein